MNGHQAKVMVVPLEVQRALMRGEGRIKNLPPDAEIVAALNTPVGTAYRVVSRSYPLVPFGEQLTVINAVLERYRAAA